MYLDSPSPHQLTRKNFVKVGTPLTDLSVSVHVIIRRVKRMSTSELKNHAGEGVDNLAVTTEDDTTAVLKSTDGLKMGKMDPNRFTSIPWSDNKTVSA